MFLQYLIFINPADNLTLTKEKREEIKNLNTIDRFNEIKKLRKQQGVSTTQTDTHSKNELDILQERVNKANREIKVVDKLFIFVACNFY